MLLELGFEREKLVFFSGTIVREYWVTSLRNKQRLFFYALIAFWICLAAGFICRTSHVAIDGMRYFSIFDDGMISMRYAKNFVQHHGLVWNIGDRVEGFTCPLWTFLMIGAVWLSGTHYAPLVIQILGAIVYVATLFFFYYSAERNKSSSLALLAGLMILFCSYPLSYWALGGMEACAICLILTVATGVQYRYENQSAGNPLILHSCLMAIAYCLRPDGWLVLVPFFGACWIDSVREKQFRRALVAPAIVLAVVALVLSAQRAYYGEWVPNTYVLKVEGYSLALRLRNGMAYLRQFRDENLILLELIALSGFTRKRVAFLNISAACIALAYQAYVGGDPWLYWRQLLPIYVSAAFAVLFMFEKLEELSVLSVDSPEPNRIGRVLVLILIFAPIILFEYLVYYGAYSSIYRTDVLSLYAIAAGACLALLTFGLRASVVIHWRRLLVSAGSTLVFILVAWGLVVANRRFLPELSGKPFYFEKQANLVDKAVLSMMLFGPGKLHHMAWAGTYPYYVDGTMIDALGKSDKRIARYPVDETVAWNGMIAMPGHAKYDLRETILKRRPDVIVDYIAWGRQDLTKELVNKYTLIKYKGVSLCVKTELTTSLQNLVSGSCPSKML